MGDVRVRTLFREEELVDDDVVRVDLVLGELLHETLRLVQRQELGDAHANERGLFLYHIHTVVSACM